MRLVLASNNAKKLAELRALFGDLDLTLVAQGDLGIAEAEEPHASFVENALAKARHAAAASGCAAIADDSGLSVDALGGAPGVISAEYAGRVDPSGERESRTPSTELVAAREARRRLQDAANNTLLLDRMRGRDDRAAAFVSTLVALRHAADPEPLIATARWSGVLLDALRGDGGFGYDPLLFIPSLGRTVAELNAATKNEHSHRAQAARAMRQLLSAHWRIASRRSR